MSILHDTDRAEMLGVKTDRRVSEPVMDLPVNCIRCRHCSVAKEPGVTDFAQAIGADGLPDESAIIPIYCAKQKRNRPAYIWETCPMADGRIHGSYGTKYHGRPDRSPYGDKLCFVGGIERIFLRTHFYDAREEALSEAVSRSWRDIRHWAQRNGVPRNPARVLEQIRKGTAAARSQVKAPRVNEAQRAYIAQCQERDFWPKRGAHVSPQGNETQLAISNRAIKAEILREVAARGPELKWETIINHAHELQPGAKRWRKRWEENRPRSIGKFLQQV